jgi:hypothetical protein
MAIAKRRGMFQSELSASHASAKASSGMANGTKQAKKQVFPYFDNIISWEVVNKESIMKQSKRKKKTNSTEWKDNQ